MKRNLPTNIIKADTFLFNEILPTSEGSAVKGLSLVKAPLRPEQAKIAQKTRKETLHMLAKARRKANAFLAEAEAEAAKVKQEAYEEGYQQGLAAGREEGVQSGTAEGMAVGWRTGLEQARETLEMAQKVLQAAGEAREEALTSMEGEVLQLALAISEKIARREIARDEKYLKQLVSAILQESPTKSQVIVRVPPGEGPEPAGHTLQDLADNLQVVVDDSLELGDVVVESEAGIFDGRLNTRLTGIRAALEAVDDSGDSE